MIIVRREEGDLRWATVKRRLRLNTPRDPKTGETRRRLWLWVIPFLIAITVYEIALKPYVDDLWVSILPFFAEPAGYSVAVVFESEEILDRLVGAWWFLGLYVVNAVFNTILGEEFLFRGVLLPKMEGVFGKWSWVANGVLHGSYHAHQPWVRISELALPQHLDGHHRPLCTKCVLFLLDTRNRIGFGIGAIVALDGHLYTQQFPQPRDPLARECHRTDMKEFVMASAAPFPAGSPSGAEHRGNLARRYPLTMFLVLAFAIGVPGMVIPLLLGVPSAPGLLWLVFVALLGSSLLVTWLADGRASVRKLLSRVVLWRFSAWRWAIILFAVPVLTVALAAASGTLTSPARGWAAEIGWYLFNTLIFGALTLNLWEETAWAGFAQSRWMARHGLLVGSLITAVFFAAIHVPLQFEGDPRWSRILASTGLVFLTALIARYLIGMHLLDTRGSILAAGVQHASWNAAQKLEAVQGGDWNWQMVTAVALLTLLLTVGRRIRRPQARPVGPEAEKAAAAQWITPPAPRSPNPEAPAADSHEL